MAPFATLGYSGDFQVTDFNTFVGKFSTSSCIDTPFLSHILFVMPGKKHKKGKQEQQNVAPTALTYHGPIVSKKAKAENETIVTNLNFTGLLTSTAGGAIDSFYSNDPASYAIADWTNLAAVWHEYRVLGFRVEFFPYNRYSKTTVVCTPMIVVVDRADASLLGSYQTGMDHSSAKKVSLEDPWIMEAKMASTEEAAFISTGSTSAQTWIKFYSSGLSVSTVYGRTFVYLLLQLRGRR